MLRAVAAVSRASRGAVDDVTCELESGQTALVVSWGGSIAAITAAPLGVPRDALIVSTT
jgi:hypothetical protein